MPFDRITAAGQLHDRYRYEFGPLLLVALEEAAGVDPIHRMLAAMLKQPERIWDYQKIREAALAAGVSTATWRQCEARCVRRFASGCLPKYADR